MTLSRTTALALFTLLAGPALAAEPLTLDEAEANYRKMFPTIDQLDCPPGAEGDIVICGRRDPGSGQRIPVQGPPEGERLAGEPTGGQELVDRRERCSTVGPNQNCGGALPVAPAAAFLIRLLGKIVNGDD